MTVQTVPAVVRPGSPLGDAFHVFDTTLRDGAQREGISYSVSPTSSPWRTLLDELGVGFIEGGWPGALPKDTEFFARAAAGTSSTLQHAPRSWRSGRPARPVMTVPRTTHQVQALLDSQCAR